MSTLCIKDSFKWALNANGEDPCTVASQVIQQCQRSGRLLSILRRSSVYRTSNNEEQDQCVCSSVMYALVSVCSACHGADYESWTDWTAHCEEAPAVSLAHFKNILIPDWTIFDVQAEPSLNVMARAQRSIRHSTLSTTSNLPSLTTPNAPSAANSTMTGASQSSGFLQTDSLLTKSITKDISGTSSLEDYTLVIGTVTVTATVSDTVQPGRNQALGSHSTKNRSSGVIAGGVVAGVTLLIAVGLLFLWWSRRRQRLHIAPSAAYIAAYGKTRPPTVASHQRPLTERSTSFISSSNPYAGSLYHDEALRSSAYSEPREPSYINQS